MQSCKLIAQKDDSDDLKRLNLKSSFAVQTSVCIVVTDCFSSPEADFKVGRG